MARTAFACIALTLAGAASSALAEPVFSNFPADIQNGSGREMSAWIQADDFHLSADTQLTGASMQWFTQNRLASWDRTLNWYVFADQGGAPGAMIAHGGGLSLLTEFDGSYAYDRYTTSFDFDAPVHLQGGANYWLGLHLSSDYSRDNLYWADAVSGQLASGHESLGGLGNNWANVSGSDRAFSLIPSPSTGALVTVSLLTVSRRRRR